MKMENLRKKDFFHIDGKIFYVKTVAKGVINCINIKDGVQSLKSRDKTKVTLVQPYAFHIYKGSKSFYCLLPEKSVACRCRKVNDGFLRLTNGVIRHIPYADYTIYVPYKRG